jgi:hypothetical protein
MNASLHLIADDGTVWPAEAELIAPPPRADRSRRADPVAAAVGLGFIFVGFSRSGARVALRPEFVTRRGLSRLAVLIGGPGIARVAVSCDRATSSWALIRGAGPAIAWIDAVVNAAQQPQPRTLIGMRRLPPERCRDIASGRLLPLLQAWEQRGGLWDNSLYGHLNAAKLLENSVFVCRAAGSERFTYRHWGTKASPIYGPEWARIVLGRDMLDQPDREVARWQEHKVNEAAATRTQHLDACDIVRRRTTGELVRVRYTRLVLPWRTADGEAMVAGTQVRRSAVVLERPQAV